MFKTIVTVALLHSLSASVEASSKFPRNALKGNVVYVAGDGLVIRNLSDGSERSIKLAGELMNPRWAPDGKHLLYMARNGGGPSGALRVIDLKGQVLVDLSNVGTTSFCHWLDAKRILVFQKPGYPQGKKLEDYDRSRNREGFYAIFDINQAPAELTWKAFYGPHSYATGSISFKANGELVFGGVKGKDGVNPDVACNKDYSMCVGPNHEPFMMPQVRKDKSIRAIGTSFMPRGPVIQKFNFGPKRTPGRIFLLGGVMMLDSNDGGYPNWSPDGEMVTWDDALSLHIASGASPTGHVRAVLQPTDTGTSGGIFPFPNEYYRLPRWSPDSRFIVSEHYRRPNNWINVYDIQTGTSADLFGGRTPDWTK